MRILLSFIFLYCISYSYAQLNVNFIFSPDNACSGTTIQFSSTVTGGGTSPYIYTWNFGDGDNSDVDNPSYIFTSTGCGTQTYNVSLTVIDTTGGGNLTGSASKSITVLRVPDPQLTDEANLEPFSNCINSPGPGNENFLIEAHNITPDNSCIISYSIDWGDGTPQFNSTNSDFIEPHTYTQLGAFNLKFTAIGNNGCSATTTYPIKNQSNPAGGINSLGNTQGCAPQTYTYVMNQYETNSPGTQYTFDFGDGSPNELWTQDSAIQYNGYIDHTFNSTSCGLPNNEFIVSVNIENSCKTTSGTVAGTLIWTSAVPHFEIEPPQGCINTTCFAFINQTEPGHWGSNCSDQTTFQWNFGNGNTSTLQNPPCQYYNATGTFPISLTTSNNCGTTTYNQQVIVNDPPVAAATASPLNGCAPLQVSFNNFSSGYDIQFTWDVSPTTGWNFINGTGNHSQNPIIEFVNAGTYTVTLSVQNGCGTDSKTFSIKVKSVPGINIPFITDQCIHYTYTGNAIYDSNGGIISYYLWAVNPPTGWTFIPPSNANSKNPTITFDQIGNYQITVQATNECGTGSSTSNDFDIIVMVPVNAGIDTSVCLNSGNLILSGNPSGGSWSGPHVTQNGIFTPSEAGIFTLTYSRGTGSCHSEDQIVITVLSLPSVDAGDDISICADQYPFDLTGQPAGGTWSGTGITDPVQGTFDPSVSGTGNFTVSYTISDNITGCFNSDQVTVTVNPKPIVSFGFEPPTCVNQVIHFINNCSFANTFLWDFGDGNTSGSFEPDHIYTIEGTYNIKLIASSSATCESFDSSYISITSPPPVPFFEVSPKSGCAPLTVYIDIDETQYGADADYSWDFGNGLIVNGLHPPDSVVYDGGLYADTVYYLVFNSVNSCDSFHHLDSVVVFPRPVADFGMQHDWDCTPVEVKFKNFTKGLPNSFVWDFGDSSPLNYEFEPTHTFTTGTTSSNYFIQLMSFNECGSDTLIRDLLVKPNTVDASFETDQFLACENDTIFFRNYSTDTSFAITNCYWDFGDSEMAWSWDALHLFAQEGTYIVKLHVDNGCGHDDAFDTITINPVPEIELEFNPEVCVHDTVFFRYTSDLPLAGIKWYFGDGDSSVNSNPYHIYFQDGYFNITFVGTAADGFTHCANLIEEQIFIKPAPEAQIFTDTSGCAPLMVTFQGDEGSFHLWNFGENSYLTSNPTHTFSDPGLYHVTLISENEEMCRDSDTTEIRIYPSPVSSFDVISAGGYPESLTFANNSTGATECFWDFGNGELAYSCAVNDPVLYEHIGEYSIMLVTTNQYGCIDTLSKMYRVMFKGLYIPNAFAPDDPDPEVSRFLPKGIGIKEYFIQIFDTWGNVIWESSELVDSMPAEGWDGKNKKGELYPPDVYVWKAHAKFIDGSVWEGVDGKTFGTVTLIR